MVFQGQVLFLFGVANHQFHAVEQLVMGFQMVTSHGIKAFRDGFLQVLVDVCFWVFTHEIGGGTEIDYCFIILGDRLCFGEVMHPFHAFHVAVQLTAHNDTVSTGENFGFLGTGEVYFYCRPFDGLRGLNFYYSHIIHAGDESLALVMLTTFFERNLVYGIVKAQRSFIINYGIGIRIMVFYRHIAQSLIAPKRHLGALAMTRTFATTDKGLIHQVLGFVVLAFLQESLDFGQRLQSQRVAVVTRRARP